jgi:translation initiation factor IF-3
MRKRSRKPQQKRNANQHKINKDIRYPKIRVVEGLENDIYDTSYALKKAVEMDLDLVLISDKGEVPICKIIDYKKFLYQQKRRKKELEEKNKKVVMKEIRFGPNTGEHDIKFKFNHAKKFLSEGNRLKAFVFFKGRTIVHKDRGHKLLLEFAQSLEEYGKVTQLPKMEGKKLIMLMEPNKNG